MMFSRIRTVVIPRDTGIWGGGLLLASIALSLIPQQPIVTSALSGLVGAACFSAALFVFAFGAGQSAGIVQRRSTGSVALASLGVWTFLVVAAERSLAAVNISSSVVVPPILMFLPLVIAWLLAGVVVINIARGTIVPRPWSQIPLWAVVIVSFVWIVLQVIGTVFTALSSSAVFVLANINGTMFTLSIGVIGVISIRLATRTPAHSSSKQATNSDMTPVPNTPLDSDVVADRDEAIQR